jgi:hypothetical protein
MLAESAIILICSQFKHFLEAIIHKQFNSLRLISSETSRPGYRQSTSKPSHEDCIRLSESLEGGRRMPSIEDFHRPMSDRGARIIGMQRVIV